MCECLERWFFKFFPTKRKHVEPDYAAGNWFRCIALISCILHNLLFIFCLALVGAGPMIINFLQAVWCYSIFLTLREREMIVYMVMILGQISQCVTMLLKDRDIPLGAFQTGGLIGNSVACILLLIFNGRALYKFHMCGGLHGCDANHISKKDIEQPLLDKQDEKSSDLVDAIPDKKKKAKA